MESNNDVNDRWSHAISAEEKINIKSRIAEYEFVKELFESKLPVGEDKSEIELYLQRLEQAITENEEIKNEEFPPERSEPDPETGKPISYKYYSASVLKQRSTQPRGEIIGNSIEGFDYDQSDKQDLDSSTDVNGHQEHLQGQPPTIQNTESVAQYK